MKALTWCAVNASPCSHLYQSGHTWRCCTGHMSHHTADVTLMQSIWNRAGRCTLHEQPLYPEVTPANQVAEARVNFRGVPGRRTPTMS